MNHILLNRIILLSLGGFFLAVIAVAFHYNDDAFLLRSRSFCQGRTAVSVTVNKNQVDVAPAVAVTSLGLTAIILLWALSVQINTTVLLSSQSGNLFPNKAPPLRP